MSYDVYWVKNRAEKIADFEHPTLLGTIWGGSIARTHSSYSICWSFVGAWLRRDAIAS